MKIKNANVIILAVDDESYNLLIMEEFLEDDGYTIITAKDGEEAWSLLLAEPTKFDIVLLDRMMPKMGGMEVLEKIREHPDLRFVPVIMQTASAKNSQIIEGSAAGAYYYITKPYKEDMFRSVVSAAVVDRLRFKALSESTREYPSAISYLERGQFRFSNLEECYDLATLLSCAFPEPAKVVTGITELMLNALEFGQVGLNYAEKTELIDKHKLYDYVSEKLAAPENREKSVKVMLTRTESEVIVSIEDEGKGFDWKKYINFSPDRATDNHGRGIATAKLMSFDSLSYMNDGSKVVAKVII